MSTIMGLILLFVVFTPNPERKNISTGRITATALKRITAQWFWDTEEIKTYLLLISQIMSKRRGKVLVDALSVERRDWYSELQKPGIQSYKEYEHVHQVAEGTPNRHYLIEDDDDDNVSHKLLSISNESNCKYANVIPEQWIKSLNRVKTKSSNLICFHGVGNNHSYFKKWGKALSASGIALYSICVPGHMNRFNEPMSMTFVEMANYVYASAKTMRILNESEVILFGHCSGAIIAYEFARLMEKDSLSSLKQLIVSSAISPLVQTKNNKNKRGVIKYFLQSDKDLLERVKLMGGMVDENFTSARMDMVKLNLKMIRRDFLIQEKYLIHLMDDPHYDVTLHSTNTSTVVSSAASVVSTAKGSALTSLNATANNSFTGSVASELGSHSRIMAGTSRVTPMASAKGSVNNSANNSVTHHGSADNHSRSLSPGKSHTHSHNTSAVVSVKGSAHNSANNSVTHGVSGTHNYSRSASPTKSHTNTVSQHSSYHNSSAASVTSANSHNSFGGGSRSSSKKKGDDSSSEEEEEDFYIPPVLYKLHVPITTILAVDSQIVELKDVNAWSELTNNYEHVAIHDGGHNYLRMKENRTEVLSLIEKAFNGGPV